MLRTCYQKKKVNVHQKNNTRYETKLVKQMDNATD